ncbi:MAG: hypothetical protein AAFN09_02970 [Pseudomonadota bacterium]
MTEPLRLLTPIALTESFDALFALSEAPRVALERVSRLNPDIARDIAEGVAWDLALTNPHHVEELRAAGHLDGADHWPLLRTPLAFAERAEGDGAASPPVRDRASIAECVTGWAAAGLRIGFTETGTSGDMLRKLLTDLDARVPPEHLIGLPGGGPMRALLAGEVDIACLPLSNIAPVPQARTLAICPDELGVHVEIDLLAHPDAGPEAQAIAAYLLKHSPTEAWRNLGSQRVSVAP